MSADKRKVSTDALETLGTIIGDGEKRDAIHLAVEPAIAAEQLYPGEDVGFVQGGVGYCDNPVGIVDPFLKVNVMPGQRFWLVVYPRQITSLRHVWTHPAFPEEPTAPDVAPRPPSRIEAEEFLWNFAREIGATYYELMSRARAYLETDDYWSEGGRFDGLKLPREFWDHYERVTGETVDPEKRWSFFSCSC